MSEQKKEKGKSKLVMQIINGDVLTKDFVLNNLPFIFYTIFLLLILVSKSYYDKQLTKKVDNCQKELNEIMGDYVAAKARLEEETRRTQLVEDLAPLGLKETVNPTKVIRIRENKE